MSIIWTADGIYRRVEYTSEGDLEASIIKVQKELFGLNRVYLDVKKKIGSRDSKRNIPDGYLLDLNGRNPRLYVVENELARHDPLSHIAVQLLEFALAFEATPRTVHSVILESIQQAPSLKAKCEEYIAANGFRNLDHLLNELVHSEFAALVIIDQVPDRLENVLAKKLGFTVEILELARYEDLNQRTVYLFKPFLEEFNPISSFPNHHSLPITPPRDIEEIDTIVVPAREEGFQDTFIRENRWYAIRIGGVLRSRIKYIAAYRTAPISAITHVAAVASIQPWENTDKFVVNFAEPAREIAPIGRGQRLKHLQNTLSTSYSKLLSATSLDDL